MLLFLYYNTTGIFEITNAREGVVGETIRREWGRRGNYKKRMGS